MENLLPLIFSILANQQLMSALGPLLSGLANKQQPVQLQQSESLFDVRWLQNSLSKVGERVDLTGHYDDQTKAAVVSFQKKKGLVADGWAGTKTCAVLFAQLAK